MDKSLNEIFGNDFAVIAKITSYNMKFVSEAKKRCMEVLEFKMKCILYQNMPTLGKNRQRQQKISLPSPSLEMVFNKK